MTKKNTPAHPRAKRGQAEPHTYFSTRLPTRLVRALEALGPSRTGALRTILELAFGKGEP